MGAWVSELLEKAGAKAGELLESRGLKGLYNDWVVRSSKNVDENIPKLGKVLTETIHGYTEKSNFAIGEVNAQLEPLIKKAEQYPDVRQNFYDYFTGVKQHPNPAVDELKNTLKRHRAVWYGNAAQAGIKVGPPTADGWARVWKPGDFIGDSYEKKIKDVMKQGHTYSQAQKIIDMAANRYKMGKSYNLRVGRTADLPGWRRDIYSQLEALHREIRDVTYSQTFGPKSERLTALLDEVGKTQGAAKRYLAQRYADYVLRRTGRTYEPYTEVERNINSVLAARYLGGISIRHASQSLNAVVFGGRIKPFVESLVETIGHYDDAKAFAMRSLGMVGDSIGELSKQLEEGLSPERKLGKLFFKTIGFPQVLQANRIVTANYGKYLVEDYVDEYARKKTPYVAKKLAQLGVDADRAVEHGLTPEDYYRAASRTTEVTMSPMEHRNLPIAWREHPWSRWLTQYKPFIYMQSQLIKNEVLQPAMEFVLSGGRRGSLRPMGYYALLFPAAGEVIGDAYNLLTRFDLKSRPRSKYWLDRYVDNIAQLGGLAMASDLVFALTSDRWGSTPLGSELQDLFNLWRSKHKARQAVRQIPIVGRGLATKMHPIREHKPPGLEGWFYEGHLTKSLYKALGLEEP